LGVRILENESGSMMSRIGPREIHVDNEPVPPIRTISVIVLDADGIYVLCTATMINSGERLVRLNSAPQDGLYTVGDYVHYGWLPDCEFAVVKFGRGQF